MATPAGQFRPWRLILTFIGITAVLYGLVFFTPGSNTPKLGIDLQGGTRITLTARTVDGSDPTRAQMQQARTIMENRVNGSGVVGAEVQIDGVKNLVITVPGNEDLSGLTRSAQMNIRPVLTDASGNPAISYPAGYSPAAATDTSGATTATASGSATRFGDRIRTADHHPGHRRHHPGISPGRRRDSGAAAAATDRRGDVTGRPARARRRGPDPPARPRPRDTAAATAPAADTAAATAPAADTAADAHRDPQPAPPRPARTPPRPAPMPPPRRPPGRRAATRPTPPNPRVTTKPSWTTWETAAIAALPTLSCADLEPYRGLDNPNKPLIACDVDGTAIYLLDKTLIAGTQIDTATSGQSSQGAGWVVNMTFKSDGYATWSSYTASHTGTLTAMTLDGQVVSAPRISGPITTPGHRDLRVVHPGIGGWPWRTR